MPQQGRAGPAFEQLAQEVIAGVRPQPRYLPPELPPVPLTAAERAEAEKAERKAQVCSFCLGFHALPNSPGCPRLASFEVDGDGKVKAGTFFEGKGWAKGRVVFFEDTKEDDADDGK